MNMDRKRKTVSAVISTKNEEETIEEIIAKTKPFVDEVVVVDGHSKDRTRELAEKAGARVVMDNGKGKGDAIRVGIQNVKSDIIVFLDADGSHDPADIPRLVKPIAEGKADLVIGSRGKGGSDELHGDLDGFLRLMGSDIILLIINWRWKQHLTDCENGFRAIKTAVARSIGLKENIATIEQEMTIKCLKNGFRVIDIPAHEYSRKHGKSSISLLKMGFRFAWTAIKYNL